MIIFREISPLKHYLERLRIDSRTIGFVPTMGALHEGHLSLIRKSKASTNFTVCSIFVNPTQFNDPKDFQKYPITTATDIQLLEKESTDILFIPSVEEVYPAGLKADQHYDLGYLETILEGAHRPGHFQGVCQVVHRLLQIVQPHQLFLGQKDFQQCMVLKRLVEQLGLPIQIVIAKTVRESSGLAMSSRNIRLNDELRQKATAIYQSLMDMKEQTRDKTVAEMQAAATDKLLHAGFEKIDYVAIADANSLKVLDAEQKIGNSSSAVALIAAFLGGVRLIDNMILT